MSRAIILAMLLAACDPKDAGTGSGSGSGSTTQPTAKPPVDAAVAAIDAPPASDGDGADAVAQLVVHDVGTKALGSQKIDASCVAVLVVPAGTWTVAAAHLKDCGDKTARSLVWLYKRTGNGKWSEDYAGQPPKCWKGVPIDLRAAIATATSIPTC